MPSRILNKLVAPQLPAAALGLNSGTASAVLLDRRRRRGGTEFEVRRAATITLPESLISPSFDEPNVSDADELADALAELVTSAGLARQRRWSIALPEAATRTAILTLENDQQTSRAEIEEVLRWKIERAFGVPLDELRVRRERLSPDTRGRARYLAAGVHLSVMAEYEAAFARLGWRAGLILPRHLGEARWLMPPAATRSKANGTGGDAMLVSSHAAGFTAVLLHNAQPLIVRAVSCDEADCADELYRLLLFYRDRATATNAEPSELSAEPLRRLLVVGRNNFGADVFSRERVREVVNETLGVDVRALDAATVGLVLPPGELSFDQIAAPAGLATLAWQ